MIPTFQFIRPKQFAAALAGTFAFACLSLAAPAGVPRELAKERAQLVSNVRYGLRYTIGLHPENLPGHEELRFTLRKADSLLLDFREGSVGKLLINGSSSPAQNENGHLRLPAQLLHEGENTVAVDFTAPVAPAGKAITRYDDTNDGSTYLYTLFVPMDASMAFPCFDQPDLKGRFTLEIAAPKEWTVIANSAAQRVEDVDGITKHYRFTETPPLSTYLFAFAAGPFQQLGTVAGKPNMYVRRSQVSRAQSEVSQLQDTTAAGMQFLARYFAQPYPFSKYDMVLIPGFPYGGMEHAGATFLNEDSMLFQYAPTETDRFNRSVVLLHELTHQWFGDFTTMRWFDDLWLKEGFAQYMAFRALAETVPPEQVWKRFYQEIKPAAYGIDITKGTTPIYQDIPNLKDAKSAYGAIVYSKAPGLLRQLAFVVGDDAFRSGLRTYLHEHPYGNAEWSDLVRAMELASGQNLQRWASAWIRRRGMPEVRAEWACDSQNRLRFLRLHQRNVLDEGGTWPIATQVLLGYEGREPVKWRTEITGETSSVDQAAGKPCPAYVFANDDDYAYGLFLPDEKSRNYLLAHVEINSNLFERTLLWGSLWEATQFAELMPAKYLNAAMPGAAAETDESLVESLGAHATTALHHYVNATVRGELTPRFESMAVDHALRSPQQGLRIMWFRALVDLASSPAGLEPLEDLITEKTSIPGVQLRPRDRWAIVSTLLSQRSAHADAIYEAEKKRDKTDTGLKYSYIAGAAKPDRATKQWYFDDYLHNASRREDWIQGSLPVFNGWNEAALTFPYLQPALQALPQMKQQRKIFFVLAWLNAFIKGQESAEADQQVHDWLKNTELDTDLRLKVLQAADSLHRTVKIRQRFP